MYTTILLDLDGTLIDSAADIAASVNHVRASYGLEPMTLAEVTAAVGDGLGRLLQRTIPVAGPEPGQRYWTHHWEHCLDHTRLYEGVRAGLEAMHGKAALGLVTNKPQEITQRILRELDIERYFRAVVGGDTDAGRKPDPGPLLRAMELISTGPWHVLMVGDSHADVTGGIAAGTATAFVTWGFRDIQCLGGSRPDHVLHRFDELLPLLAYQNGRIRTVYDQVGAEQLWQLARAFYSRVDQDDRIRAMFPRSLEAPIEHQAEFFIQFFGGPAEYSRKRGHPALRRRHAPFPLDRVARDAWVENMMAAMQEVGIAEPAAGVMRRYFEHTATFLRNR